VREDGYAPGEKKALVCAATRVTSVGAPDHGPSPGVKLRRAVLFPRRDLCGRRAWRGEAFIHSNEHGSVGPRMSRVLERDSSCRKFSLPLRFQLWLIQGKDCAFRFHGMADSGGPLGRQPQNTAQSRSTRWQTGANESVGCHEFSSLLLNCFNLRRLDVHKRRAVNSRTVKSLLAQLTWRLVPLRTSRARRCARADVAVAEGIPPSVEHLPVEAEDALRVTPAGGGRRAARRS